MTRIMRDDPVATPRGLVAEPRGAGPGVKRPTIADIAKRAGVSKGAVSYALDGRPGVSQLTRARILAAADEPGWTPNSAARALLSSPDRPTAILYDNDVMAVAGVAVAQELGLSAPGDVSLVAWDDSALCQLVHPPLTALSRDISAYGAHAAERLLRLIDGEPVTTFQDRTALLVPRGSTGPAPHP
jgi:DNA-binding LacI/PurR family transcriptional regulator